jgi:hypothetical protein
MDINAKHRTQLIETFMGGYIVETEFNILYKENFYNIVAYYPFIIMHGVS